MVLHKQKKRRSIKTRKMSNSRAKNAQKLVHMQGCPAGGAVNSSNFATSIDRAQRSSSGFITGSNQIGASYSISSPKDGQLSRRTRNERQLQQSQKRTLHGSKSSKSRSNSKSNGGVARRKRSVQKRTPNRQSAKAASRHMQDAACSPIKFNGTFGNGTRES